jgi:hypothetical protein
MIWFLMWNFGALFCIDAIGELFTDGLMNTATTSFGSAK